MPKETNTSKLLRLKRYEQPPSSYFDDFLFEFRRRQRAEMHQRSTREILWDRMMSLAPSFRVPQFAYAAIVAVAVTASVFIVTQKPTDGNALASAHSKIPQPALSLTSKPVTISDTLPAAARVGGSLSSHYVLQPRPVSNEQPLSF
ncbi:MAG: hypothetical protein WCQ57_05710 [Verrucomicrobiota bacterium]